MNHSRPFVVALLLVSSTVVWRRGDYFSGSLDVVVVGKALLSCLALVVAFQALHAGEAQRRRLGTGSCWLLAVMLSASLLGAAAQGTLTASAVIAVRVAMLAATVFFLLRAFGALQVLGAVIQACGWVAAVAALTGLPTAASGRLEGGLPPLNPNELAMLAGVCVLGAAWRTVLGEARWSDAVLATAFLAVIWATGSRTALLMVLLGVAVMAVQVRRARVGLVVGALVLAVSAAVVLGASNVVSAFLQRDGAGTSTLDSRFIAWRAAQSWAETAWQQVFGGGLSVKLIPVDGQWWNEQLLDSSWVSALVQAGLLGLVTAAVWTVWSVAGVLQAPRPHRILFLGLLTFLLGRSVLESGLFDATPSFLLFVGVALAAEGGSRARLRAEAAGERDDDFLALPAAASRPLPSPTP